MPPRKRTYRRIVTSFWRDREIRALSLEERLLLLYLFTNHHTNMAGLYWLPLDYAAQETGIDLEVVEAAIAGPLRPFASYDHGTEEVFVHKLARHNLGGDLKGGDKRKPSIQRVLDDAHSEPLVARFFETYPDWPLSPPGGGSKPLPEEAPQGPPEAPSEALGDEGAYDAIAVTGAGAGAVTGQTEASTSYPVEAGGEPPTGDDVDQSDGLSDLIERYPDAGRILQRLEYFGEAGKAATAATLRTRFLYRTEDQGLPDPSVKELDFDRRIEVVASAVLEFAAKGETRWDTRLFAGYVRRLRNAPAHDSEAADWNGTKEAEVYGERLEDVRSRVRSQHDAEVARLNAEGAGLADELATAKTWLEGQPPEVQDRVSRVYVGALSRLGVRPDKAPGYLAGPAMLNAIRGEQEKPTEGVA